MAFVDRLFRNITGYSLPSVGAVDMASYADPASFPKPRNEGERDPFAYLHEAFQALYMEIGGLKHQKPITITLPDVTGETHPITCTPEIWDEQFSKCGLYFANNNTGLGRIIITTPNLGKLQVTAIYFNTHASSILPPQQQHVEVIDQLPLLARGERHTLMYTFGLSTNGLTKKPQATTSTQNGSLTSCDPSQMCMSLGIGEEDTASYQELVEHVLGQAQSAMTAISTSA
ncbi:MAG: hypothetical protein NUV65_00215 [Candidatus Roizmanbacteria bacterium]|nr:hypothetical protein [Candidatus Roizmanbacteria bacterium]